MSLISELLVQARFELKDLDKNQYSDYQLIEKYNEGNKILRKLILDNFPSMLAITETGTITNSLTTLTKKTLRINDIRVNGNKVCKIDLSQVQDKTKTGTPIYYQMINLNTLSWYPVPDKEYTYEVLYIPEGTPMDETTDSGYPSEIELLLVQFIVSRLTGTDDITTTWASEIGNILGNLANDTTVIQSYW